MPWFVVLSLIFLVTLTEMQIDYNCNTISGRNSCKCGPSDGLHSNGNTIAWQELCDGTMAVAVKEAGFSLEWT